MSKKQGVLIREFSWAELQTEILAASEITDRDDGRKWLGGQTGPELTERMRKGDTELASKAEKAFDTALAAVLPSTVGGYGERTSGPVGGYPNVPAYLAGHPANMYRREPSPDLGPVRLIVDLTTTCNVKPETLLARGVATAALAYAIQTTRPVELWIMVGLEAYGSKDIYCARHRVGVAPLDLSRVATAVSSIGLARRMYRFHGETRKGKKYHAEYPKHPSVPAREYLGLGKNDVYVPPIHTTEEKAVVADPMAWLLDKVGSQLRDAEDTWDLETMQAEGWNRG